MELERVPVEWAVTYPVRPNDPIGRIRRDGSGFRTWLRHGDLGWHADGDAASEAVWERYLQHIRAEHDSASRTRGSHERSGVRPSSLEASGTGQWPRGG